jgi:hypothetical protein
MVLMLGVSRFRKPSLPALCGCTPVLKQLVYFRLAAYEKWLLLRHLNQIVGVTDHLGFQP